MEVFVDLQGYSVVVPKNANALDSSYHILDGKNLSITTQEHETEGDSIYNINHERILLKQVLKQDFYWNSAYEKVFQVRLMILTLLKPVGK